MINGYYIKHCRSIPNTHISRQNGKVVQPSIVSSNRKTNVTNLATNALSTLSFPTKMEKDYLDILFSFESVSDLPNKNETIKFCQLCNIISYLRLINLD